MLGVLFSVILLAESALVNIQDVAPGIRLDIRYATARNFTGTKLYEEAACYLRAPAARALAAAQRELEKQGLGLKIYDCYRPLSVQRKLWKLVPDERYVANPEKGSRHNRGAAVDLTLVDRNGRELPMPTEYDDFSERAHRNYNALPESVIRNRALLEDLMRRHGFEPLPTEWWHFDFTGWEQYPPEDVPFSELKKKQ
ncbi:MAG TPA: D-alanyl-D-alanine dipeptidase [Bryobacteraceae bacterium]|jgi:D-alanyl-D-alanine dipeptidase|nr:D-alanyl-D-alanine dipeptidase [Bryobacteraceae bacterium]HOQ47872.1 D-alanyl-D-alanine dipeptidase [Bryobacteraceae bacterium]HPQ15189.1 D-alanyl-D-alanine dipeptidase [Bryobacteraceae bacterium]HPU71113.1 D-alanyl-D-alanine dipeptidase [Bryobacteraceae bacterium]